MSKTSHPVSALALRSQHVREHLYRQLPGLPVEVAHGLDTLTLSLLVSAWMDCDERLTARDYDDDSQH